MAIVMSVQTCANGGVNVQLNDHTPSYITLTIYCLFWKAAILGLSFCALWGQTDLTSDMAL